MDKQEDRIEKALKEALKFYEEDFKSLSLLKDGIYMNEINAYMNFARFALKVYHSNLRLESLNNNSLIL